MVGLPCVTQWFARETYHRVETKASARRACLLLGALLAASTARAEMDEHPKGYVCYRAAQPIAMDGKLNDPAWSDAPWTDEFVDIEGDKKPRPRFRTRVKMLWDDDYFYIGVDMEEPHLQASFTEYDSPIFVEDNDFEVFVDPNGDNHRYGEFEINALNTGWDLLLVRPYKDGGPALNTWGIPGLKTAVHLDGTLNDPSDTDRGWSLEMAFPWKSLGELDGRREAPKDGDQWRVNFSRVEWVFDVVDGKYTKPRGRREDNWVWSPQWVINMHRPETWGYVQFSEAAGGDVEFRPDPIWPARALLHQIYYAQVQYRREHNVWAKTLDQLGLAGLDVGGLVAPPRIETTESLFEVTAEVKSLGGEARRLHIRQDSLIWEE